MPMMAAALSTYAAGLQQIVIVGEDGRSGSSSAWSRSLSTRSRSRLALAPAQQAALARLLPLVAAMKPIDGRAAAYVCRHFACLEPATTRRPRAPAACKSAGPSEQSIGAGCQMNVHVDVWLRGQDTATTSRSKVSSRSLEPGPTRTCDSSSKGCSGRCID